MILDEIPFPEITLPALVLISITGLLLLSSRNIRWLPLILGLQYVGVFLLVSISSTIGLALVKLAAGWMAGLLLGVGHTNAADLWEDEERSSPSSSIFRVLVAVLAGLTAYSMSSSVAEFFPTTGLETVAGGLMLASLGLIHIGLTAHPLRVTIGLLTVISGFEILYVSLENSILISGLLAALNLGVALVGTYLVVFPSTEEFE
jgi:hypothetical protein